MPDFKFEVLATRGNARAGRLTTPHGVVETPVFMPVGTVATVKALDTQDVEATNAPIILANTYHLYLRPGMDTIQKSGGVHQFMGWDKPMLTDSGGFQVFSLGNALGSKTRVKLTDEGAEFTSHLDGTKHFFSPEKAVEIQRQIGADIMMTFDECTPDAADYAYARAALDRTHKWAKQCRVAWDEAGKKTVYGKYQSQFGIIQGALHKELRRESAQAIVDLDFDGVALGGESIGYNMAATVETIDWVRDILPEEKPRYTMGVGRDPGDLVAVFQQGIDMCDCVAPTRLARNGAIYHGSLVSAPEGVQFVSEFGAKGRLQIGNAQFSQDFRVIQEGCDCFTCTQGYTRAYLHHLYRLKELAYYRLASIHNVRFMVRLTEEIRSSILNDQ